MKHCWLLALAALFWVGAADWTRPVPPAPVPAGFAPGWSELAERGPMVQSLQRVQDRPEHGPQARAEVWSSLRCGGVRHGVCACFAPGASPAQIESFYAWVSARALPQPYSHQARWTQTATNGPVSGTSAITLTYSFVPDFTTGDPSTSNTIHATFDAQFGSRAAWKNLFAGIFEDWAARCGITFVEAPDDGAPWPTTPGVLGQRGDIRITSSAIDGTHGVLAYAYTPNNGDMSFDSAENWANPTNNYRFFRNTLMHELGHAIGLLHVNPRDGTKLMEALLNLGFEGPQDDDIRGAVAYYGDACEPNDTAGAACNLGGFSSGLTYPNLALHSATDQDWYSISDVAGRTLVVAVTPTGGAYNVGPDPGTPMPVNTLAIHPLRVEVYHASGTGMLAAATAATAGAAAQTGSFVVPASQASIRIRVFTSSQTGGVQRYALTVSQGAPVSRTLTLTSAPGGAGVTLSPPAESAGSSVVTPSTVSYPGGSAVTLTTPAQAGGYTFVRWRVDGVEQGFAQSSVTVVLDADRTAEVVRTSTLAVNAGPDQSIVAGDGVALQAQVVGGVGSLNFAWWPPEGLSDPTSAAPWAAPAATTEYTVTATDALGRSASDIVRVEVFPALQVSAGPDRVVLADRAFTLTATASGGTPPYAYSWSPSDPLNNPFSQVSSGVVTTTTEFIVTVTDAAAREAEARVLVEIAPPLQVRVTGSGLYAPGAALTLEAQVSGGVPPISYAWTPQGVSGPTNEATLQVAPARTTTYTVSVTDALQQRVSVGVLVSIAAPLTVVATASNDQVGPGERITLSATTSGGEPPLTYLWQPGGAVADVHQPATSAEPQVTTRYTVMVTDRLGQSAASAVEVRVGGPNISPVAPAGLCGFGVTTGLYALLLLGGARHSRRILRSAGRRASR